MRSAVDDVESAEIKVVGKSGQISLGKRFAGKILRLEHLEDGAILLTAVAMVPESQLWTLSEPHRGRIARGMEWAASHPPRETSVESLGRRKAGRPKVRKSGRKTG
jgi:hypothetical protein